MLQQLRGIRGRQRHKTGVDFYKWINKISVNLSDKKNIVSSLYRSCFHSYGYHAYLTVCKTLAVRSVVNKGSEHLGPKNVMNLKVKLESLLTELYQMQNVNKV
ncbi:hypothetical protein P8452_63215 [Trifolium repens]|nr:hypothetical protein P8452_63215 [Trifolium repens]